MAYSVFMHRADSIYDDSPSEQYQFPSQYLGRAQLSIGDWIVYLEPRKVSGSRGYFAIAKLANIIPDPKVLGMYLAIIKKGSYLDFPNFVAFSDDEGPVERGLLNEVGKISGRAQSAVRPISAVDFDRILERGLRIDNSLLPRQDVVENHDGFAEESTQFAYEFDRDRVLIRTSKVVRDRAFRQLILGAYEQICAISGLKFINGGGRAEVQAAHIMPVEFNGPDIIQNGIALSGTVHWMFDRGLISLADNLEIIISRQANDRQAIERLLNLTGKANMPKPERLRPAPQFLQWHRTNIFKQ